MTKHNAGHLPTLTRRSLLKWISSAVALLGGLASRNLYATSRNRAVPRSMGATTANRAVRSPDDYNSSGQYGAGPYGAGLYGSGGVGLPAPQMISPNSITASSSPNFEWGAVAGATTYTLVVYHVDDDQIVSVTTHTSSDAGCSSGTGTCMIQPANLILLQGDYRWLIRASDGTIHSPWSSYP